MNQVVPRFEFRTFGQNLAWAEGRIQKLSQTKTVRESKEVYILRSKEWHRNIKIRGGRLELKELVEQRQGLQRWKPAGHWDFPIGLNEIQETILRGSRTGNRHLATATFSKRRLLDDIVRHSHELFRANVFKRRVIFNVNCCSTEVDDILVNGALIRSVAIESEDADTVIATRLELRLGDCENISYPLAIARIMGLSPVPDEDTYG